MKLELIVMLTHHDKTVANAAELFETARDLPVAYWGFKDIGLAPSATKALVEKMKTAGKTTFLEVVSLSEAEGLAGARLAVEAGFDILMGTVFFDSIGDYLADKPIKYFPFPGHVHSHPSILDGSIEDIVSHARDLQAKGVDGLDLLTYRYIGNAPQLLREVVQATPLPVVSAGSIGSFERIAEVKEAGAWAFTVGTAFFEARFAPNKSFRDNILRVVETINE